MSEIELEKVKIIETEKTKRKRIDSINLDKWDHLAGKLGIIIGIITLAILVGIALITQ